MTLTLEHLQSLHTLIGDAIKEIDTAFRAEKLDYPSLESPFTSDEAEGLASSPKLAEASKIIIAASSQLIATVRSPFGTVCSNGMSFLVSACLRFTEQIHVVEILRGAGEKGLHVDDMAAKLNVDPSKLAHAMRLLATHHVFTEVAPNVFKNNRISSYIDTGKGIEEILQNPQKKYQGTSGIAALVACAGDEFFKSAAFLTEAMTRPTLAHSRLPNHAAFNLAWNTDAGFFQFMEQPENKFKAERFGMAIKATEGFARPAATIDGFSWKELPEGSLVVDVGGGLGTSTMLLQTHFPHLRYIIQDLPSVCALGEKVWQEQAPLCLSSGQVRFEAHDFFNTQPQTQASIFYLRTIIHDWDDTHAKMILRQLRLSATPTSFLIVGEHVMPYACATETNATGLASRINAGAPLPLLANFGEANAIIYDLDMNMHAMLNAQEREFPHITELLTSTGWSVVDVRGLEESHFAHIIAKPSQEIS